MPLYIIGRFKDYHRRPGSPLQKVMSLCVEGPIGWQYNFVLPLPLINGNDCWSIQIVYFHGSILEVQ